MHTKYKVDILKPKLTPETWSYSATRVCNQSRHNFN